MGRKERQRPRIVVDEHVPPQVKPSFRDEGFTTIEAARAAKLRGREELDYLPYLYAQNCVFVTSDRAFVDRVIDYGLRHAGIVFLPEGTVEQKEDFSFLAAAFIRGRTEQTRFGMRGIIIYPGHDGVHAVEKGKDTLAVSWDRLELG